MSEQDGSAADHPNQKDHQQPNPTATPKVTPPLEATLLQPTTITSSNPSLEIHEEPATSTNTSSAARSTSDTEKPAAEHIAPPTMHSEPSTDGSTTSSSSAATTARKSSSEEEKDHGKENGLVVSPSGGKAVNGISNGLEEEKHQAPDDSKARADGGTKVVGVSSTSNGDQGKKEKEKSVESLPEDESTPVQLLSLEGLAGRFKTQLDFENPRQSFGLDENEAKSRLERDGLNQLTPPAETSEIVKYLLCFTDPFMLLLILSGTLSCIAYGIDKSQEINLWIGVVLFIVVFLSSSFAYIQEGKASAVMKAFKNMLPKNCHVVRDGRLQDMNALHLVVGDVVRVSTGDQVPADLRIIYVNDLKVENSSLTGESLPISCTLTTKETRIEEAKNVCFSSSQCIEGEAYGVVYATGDHTLIGRIARLASDTHVVDTTLQKEVKGFVKKLTLFSFIMGVIFFFIGFGRGQPPITAFINGFIVVMIANVPEGLPVTVITVLTICGKRLAALNVFVKQLASMETLGSATVIASDKTGTLTQNKMSVSRLWFDLTPMSVDTVYRDMGPSMLTMNPNAANKYLSSTQTLRCLERVCAVNSRTRFDDHRELTDEEARSMEQSQALRQLDPSMTLRSAKAQFPQFLSLLDANMTMTSAKRQAMTNVRDDSKRKVIGDASETALFNFIRARQSIELVRYHNKVVFEVPFNSRNKYALTIHKPYNIPGNTDHRRILTMKGAPEIILSRCNRWMNRGKILPIDKEFEHNFQLAYETFGGFGERVLGFAQLELDLNEYPPEMDSKYSQKEENYPTKDLVFLGLISLVDPPKETVPGAIALCRSAGVRVIMVTGDHPLTAAAIARLVGIITLNTRDELAKLRGCPEADIPEEDVDAIVVRGLDLDSYTQADWDRVLTKHEVVFARTTPSQKLQIVENLQRLGEIVAVTGDGVNDSPALKKADIGVAMGISGSDVARDAGDVILMDDDFGSIVVGIREGRTIFDNLAKTIAYTVTHMPPEVIPILLNLAFGFPLGLNAILILCIDCGTELGPAISLAYEPAESDVMTRPPRNAAKDHLVTAKTVTYWYALAGAWETLSCYLAFFLVFNHFGVAPHNLPFSDSYWNGSASNNDLCIDNAYYSEDSANYKVPGSFCPNGQIYTDHDQKQILAYAQTAYWVTLTGSQVLHIFLCKTRVLSLFEVGIFNNHEMLYGVLLEIGIIIIIVFVPAHSFFQSDIFPGIFWLIVLVGWAGLFILNEPRKWLIRHYKENPIVDFLAW